jgi:hypothetical protein
MPLRLEVLRLGDIRNLAASILEIKGDLRQDNMYCSTAFLFFIFNPQHARAGGS